MLNNKHEHTDRKRWKGDVGIGYRAYSEVLRIFPRQKDALIGLGIRDTNLYAWHRGVCPSAKYLARLHNAGADVIYILTGEKMVITGKKVGA